MEERDQKDEKWHQYISVGVDKLTYSETKRKLEPKDKNDGMGMGVAIGVAFGAMFDDISMGFLWGIVLGSAWNQKKIRRVERECLKD